LRQSVGAAKPDRCALRRTRPRCSNRDWIRSRGAGRNVSQQIRLRAQRSEQYRERNARGEQTGTSGLHHAALPRLGCGSHRDAGCPRHSSGRATLSPVDIEWNARRNARRRGRRSRHPSARERPASSRRTPARREHRQFLSLRQSRIDPAQTRLIGRLPPSLPGRDRPAAPPRT
jgi:hypothetical protein